jgi:hypothetical protein
LMRAWMRCRGCVRFHPGIGYNLRMRCLALGVLTYGCLLAAHLSADCQSPGKARWPIKISVPDSANLTGKPKTLQGMIALGIPANVTASDSDFQKNRIPGSGGGHGTNEGDIVTIQGFLYLVATEDNDCEYHIQISNKPRTASDKPQADDQCVIVEVARPDAFSDPALRARAEAVREFVRSRLTAGKEPGAGNVMAHATFVKVTGQLFFDDAHLKSDGTIELRGKKGMKSQTLWELHPVVDLQFAKPPV